MIAMICAPCNRLTGCIQDRKKDEDIFHDWVKLQGPMRQRPVVAHCRSDPAHRKHRKGSS